MNNLRKNNTLSSKPQVISSLCRLIIATVAWPVPAVVSVPSVLLLVTFQSCQESFIVDDVV